MLAGGNVNIEAESDIQAGTKAANLPFISQKPMIIQTVTGTKQIADGTIAVPVVTWIPTTVTEQKGFDTVRVGSEFHTMDVTLEQDGYWNEATQTKREWFVNQVDYNVGAIAWGSAGTPNVDHNFSDLSDAQQEKVLAYLGYKKLYNFSYTNAKVNRTINGNPTIDNWTPDWANRTKTIVGIDIDGWRDKYIRLEDGAQQDILRVVSQGEAQVGRELVGQYWDQATVLYKQIKSAHTANSQTYYRELDYDSSPDRWQISYDSNGKRWYSIYDDRTGNDAVQHAKMPLWNGGTLQNSTDLNSVRIYAPNGYLATSRVINSKNQAATQVQTVGEKQELRYDVAVKVTGIRYDINTEAGGEEPWYRVWANLGSNSGFEQWTWTNGGSLRTSENRTVVSGQNLTYDTQYGISWEFREDDGSGDFVLSSGDDIIGTASASGTIPSSALTRTLRVSNGDGWGELDYTVESNAKWLKTGNITETFRDYRYNWESKYNNIEDKRLTLNYQWVSNAHDIFDNRPRYETYDTLVKNVATDIQTRYRTEQIYGSQVIWTTERLGSGNQKGFGAFGGASIQSTQGIVIDAGNNVTVSAKLSTVGTTGTISINAVGTADIKGKLPEGVTDAIAAPAVLNTQDRITVTANQLNVSDLSELRASNTNAQILLKSTTGLNFSGIATTGNTTTGQVSLEAGNSLALTGQILSGSINGKSGLQSGNGDITGSAYTFLQSAGQLNLTAGTTKGDINLPSAWLTGGTVNLTAANGAINNYQTAIVKGETVRQHGLITANTLNLTASANISTNLSADQLTANSDALDLTIAPNKVTTAANLTAKGGVALTALGDLRLQQLSANTLSLTSLASVAIDQVTIRDNATALIQGNLTMNATSQFSAGKTIDLNVQGDITQYGSRLTASALNLAARGNTNLNTIVSELSLTGLGTGNLTIANTAASLNLKQSTFSGGSLNLTNSGNLTISQLSLLTDAGGQAFRLTAGGNLNIGLIDAGKNYGTIDLTAGGALAATQPNDEQVDLRAKVITLTGRTISLETNAAELSATSTNGDVQIENLKDGATTPRALSLNEILAARGNIKITSSGDLTTTARVEAAPNGTIELNSKVGDIIVTPTPDNADKLLKSDTLRLRATGQLIVDPSVTLEARVLDLGYGKTGLLQGSVQLPKVKTQNLTLELGSGIITVAPESFIDADGKPIALDTIHLIARGNQITDGAFAGYYRFRDVNTNTTYYLDRAELDQGAKVYREANGILTSLSTAEVTALRLAPVLNTVTTQIREPFSGWYTYTGNDGREYYKEVPTSSKAYTRQNAQGQYAYTVFDPTETVPVYKVIYSSEADYKRFAQQNPQYEAVQINFTEVSPGSLNLQAKTITELAGGVQLVTPTGELRDPRLGFPMLANSIELKAQRDLGNISFADIRGNRVEISSGADMYIVDTPQAQSLKLASTGYFDNRGNFFGGRITTANNVALTSFNLELNALTDINVQTQVNTLRATISNRGNLSIRETDSLTLDQISVTAGNLTVNAGDTITVGQVAVSDRVDFTARQVNSRSSDEIVDLTAKDLAINVRDGIGYSNQLSS